MCEQEGQYVEMCVWPKLHDTIHTYVHNNIKCFYFLFFFRTSCFILFLFCFVFVHFVVVVIVVLKQQPHSKVLFPHCFHRFVRPRIYSTVQYIRRIHTYIALKLRKTIKSVILSSVYSRMLDGYIFHSRLCFTGVTFKWRTRLYFVFRSRLSLVSLRAQLTCALFFIAAILLMRSFSFPTVYCGQTFCATAITIALHCIHNLYLFLLIFFFIQTSVNRNFRYKVHYTRTSGQTETNTLGQHNKQFACHK